MGRFIEGRKQIPRIHSILLISNDFGYGRFPKPWEEIEQHLSISETGEVRLNGYGWSFGEDEAEMFDSPELQAWLETHTLATPNSNGYRKLYSKRIRISPADARLLLSVVGLMLEHPLPDEVVTDVGSWELTATDVEGKKHKDFGPLYESVTRDMERMYGFQISPLFRRILGMDNLLLFDGNMRRTVIWSAEEVIVVTVVFSDEGKPYNYLSDKDELMEDDIVYVPVGSDDRVETARVTNIEVMLPENAPYPVSKMKKIIGLVEDS